METRAMPVTGNVVKFPLDRIDGHELEVRLWELTMSGERNTEAYRAIERELAERTRFGAAVVRVRGRGHGPLLQES